MIHYPVNIKKYTGEVRVYETRDKMRYEAKIRQIHYYTTFDTEKDAINCIKEKNLTLELPIRNVLYRYDTHWECVIKDEKRLKFDERDLPIVESHIIYESSNHPVLKMEGKVVKFSHLIMPSLVRKLRFLIHLNGDVMDCRRENMRWKRPEAHFMEQNEDCGIYQRQSVLRTGTIQCRYIAQWNDPYTKKKCSRSFAYQYGDRHSQEAAKTEALAHRRKILAL